MESIKLANGHITPKTDFTDPEQLLSHLKYRARTYRTTFGFTEIEIEENLLLENSLNLGEVQILPELVSGLAAGAALLPRKNISVSGKKSASLNYSEMLAQVREQPKHVIENMLPQASVSLLAGDSGIGKSPFLVQMGLCVAAGIPFLGNLTTPGPVLYIDYENGSDTLLRFTESISKFLKLPSPPVDFRVLHQAESPETVVKEILTIRPKLVMIDALRGFDPTMEDKNAKAGERLNELLHFTESENTSILLLHHLRKPGADPKSAPKPLETSPVMEWMQQVSGPRALVNQTATRIAMERYVGKQSEVILKGHFKGSGEFGPWYIAREYNEIGEPVGYHRITGSLLLSPDHFAKFPSLPDTFSFTTAKEVYGKGPAVTANWLRRLMEAGLIKKTGDGRATHYARLDRPVTE